MWVCQSLKVGQVLLLLYYKVVVVCFGVNKVLSSLSAENDATELQPL